MPTIKQIISEIETELSSFAESGDIDRNSIKRRCLLEMKRFGNNILCKNEAILDIVNSEAILPDNFRSLKLALKLEPFGMCAEEVDQEELGTFLSKKTIVNPVYYDRVSNEYIDSCKTKVVEEIITLNSGNIRMAYTPQWLTLTPHMNKNSYDIDCANISKKLRGKELGEISINNQMMQTNFSTGKVYIQYRGYEIDEDGEIIIPEGWHGNLEKYLIAYNLKEITKTLIANNKNPQGLAQLLPIYSQDAQNYFELAQTEWKFTASKGWEDRVKTNNRKRFNSFSLPNI